jgi:hypothetical protein
MGRANRLIPRTAGYAAVTRGAADVKREIHSHLAMMYEIRAAIDDDPETVGLWQEIGIPVTMVLDWGEELVAHREKQPVYSGLHADAAQRAE